MQERTKIINIPLKYESKFHSILSQFHSIQAMLLGLGYRESDTTYNWVSDLGTLKIGDTGTLSYFWTRVQGHVVVY